MNDYGREGVFLYSLTTLWVWVEGVIMMPGLFLWCCFAGMGISRLGGECLMVCV